jgi:hypothetical protein
MIDAIRERTPMASPRRSPRWLPPTLPHGFEPRHNRVRSAPGVSPERESGLAVAAGTGPGLENVDVYTSGDVFAFGGQTIVSLDGISFLGD